LNAGRERGHDAGGVMNRPVTIKRRWEDENNKKTGVLKKSLPRFMNGHNVQQF
jgi:hypothetical protein